MWLGFWVCGEPFEKVYAGELPEPAREQTVIGIQRSASDA